jgi:hypothetical protein
MDKIYRIKKKPRNACLLSYFDRLPLASGYPKSDPANPVHPVEGFNLRALRGLIDSFSEGCVTRQALTHPTNHLSLYL